MSRIQRQLEAEARAARRSTEERGTPDASEDPFLDLSKRAAEGPERGEWQVVRDGIRTVKTFRKT